MSCKCGRLRCGIPAARRYATLVFLLRRFPETPVERLREWISPRRYDHPQRPEVAAAEAPFEPPFEPSHVKDPYVPAWRR